MNFRFLDLLLLSSRDELSVKNPSCQKKRGGRDVAINCLSERIRSSKEVPSRAACPVAKWGFWDEEW